MRFCAVFKRRFGRVIVHTGSIRDVQDGSFANNFDVVVASDGGGGDGNFAILSLKLWAILPSSNCGANLILDGSACVVVIVSVGGLRDGLLFSHLGSGNNDRLLDLTAFLGLTDSWLISSV